MGLAIGALAVGAAAAAGGAYLSASGKPKIPRWQEMDIGGEVSNAIAANEANFGRSAALTSKANVFNQEQILAMMRKAVPNFDALITKQSELLQSGLRGEVPKDVQDQLTLKSASKAVAGGYAGSGAHRNLEARDFGLTSFDITRKTLSSVQSWTESMARLFQPGMINIAESFIAPRDWIRQKQSDKENAWRVAMGQAIQDAQPSPGEAALSSGLSSLSSASSMYAGYKFANRTPSAPSTAYGAKNQVFDEYGNWNV